MFDKLNKTEWIILEFILDNPYETFYLRQIARELKISSSTAKSALDKLEKLNLITPKKFGNLRMFCGNKDDILFKKLKIAKNVDFLKPILEELTPAITIIVYGSFAKGENDKKSDIDILIISNKKNYKITNYKGYELQLVVKTPKEWVNEQKLNPAYAKEVKQGILMQGAQLE
ncbi:MAG: nucleotidyltransferase domain-containing protein [Candidatus Nanoarchaeia archaeon]